MSKIFKYPLSTVEKQLIKIPHGAEILKAGLDPSGNLCVWAKIDPCLEETPREIRIYGTGHDIPYDHMEYIDTVLDGKFIWHVFIVGGL